MAESSRFTADYKQLNPKKHKAKNHGKTLLFVRLLPKNISQHKILFKCCLSMAYYNIFYNIAKMETSLNIIKEIVIMLW